MKVNRSVSLFEEAKQVMPGGVNSPVRAFQSVDMSPLFIEKGKGNKIYDADGNEYIDYIGSWGPMILGHCQEDVLEAIKEAVDKGLSFGACTEIEVKMAKLITDNIAHVDLIRMVNSGTEAVMSAIRAARGFTKRDKIIKFEGCYHGHSDSMLVKAGSGALSFGAPSSLGVTEGAAKDTLIASYNDLSSVDALFEENEGQIAAVIVEPVAANMGVVPPAEGFLEGLRKLCDDNGSLLIFDEVITGFRLAFGGAAEYYGVRPDLVTYGKIIGGGMPVGAYGGRRDVMEMISPVGPVYQAGTLSGNPIAMTAGLVMLEKLLNNKDVYDYINQLGQKLAVELSEATGFTVNQVGSLVCLYYTKNPVNNFEDATSSNMDEFKHVFKELLERGIYIAPSQYEAMFLNACFTEEDIEKTVKEFKEILGGRK